MLSNAEQKYIDAAMNAVKNFVLTNSAIEIILFFLLIYYKCAK